MQSAKITKPLAVFTAISAMIAVLLLNTMSAGAVKPDAAAAAKPSSVSIVDIVLANDGEFDLLQSAVVTAGYVDLLNGSRQLTVFAPTDQAFRDLLGGVSEAEAKTIIESLPVEALQNILDYHVISGRRTSTSVLAAKSYQTIGGERLSRAEVAAAGIFMTDISARNGVVHVITSVLEP